MIAGFLEVIDIEPARGFGIDDRMRVLIAGQAVQLLLGRARRLGPAEALRAYRDVTTVVVHPSTMRFRGQHATDIPRVVTDHSPHLLGQAQLHGPVLLAWDAVRRGLSDDLPGNVVVHEFAHKLDMGDGIVDGTPALGTGASRQAWFEAATRSLRRLRFGPDPVLSGYGRKNPAEFFAVATEALFERSDEVALHHPELFNALVGLYEFTPPSRPVAVVG